PPSGRRRHWPRAIYRACCRASWPICWPARPRPAWGRTPVTPASVGRVSDERTDQAEARTRTRAEIDLDAVRTSVAALAARSGAAATMAVVKADGYGHGMLPCA